jgi:hypothetical protein
MYTESSNEARVCDTDETTTVIVTATCKLFVLLFVLCNTQRILNFNFLKFW